MAGTVWRILIFTALLLALVFICFQMPHFYHYVEKMLTKFLVWIQMDVGPWGPLVLALAYIPCAVLALPATMLTVLIGILAQLYFVQYCLFELLFEFVAGKKESDRIF